MDAASTQIESLRAALAAAETRAAEAEAKAADAEADAASARSRLSDRDAEILYLRVLIDKLRRDLHGVRSERKARLLEQSQMQLADLFADAAEDEAAAARAAAKANREPPKRRPRAPRKPLPEHLPRERVVVPGPTACSCCGSNRLAKLGEDVTKSLERVPATYKVVETVREKFTCRDCSGISQAPAPFFPTPRGLLGPNLLATVIFDKFCLHQPIHRQSERFACEGIDLPDSTLGDQLGASVETLRPLHDLLEKHVLAAERLHADDTTVPILAKGKTTTGRIWTYVRDDVPFGGEAAPAALFYASANRDGDHPARHLVRWTGILQADAYAGYDALADGRRKPAPVTNALCWAHSRRKFFELADIARRARSDVKAAISPIALEAVKRIDAIFDIEREINGKPPDERLTVRRERIAPLVEDLRTWMSEERAKLSAKAPVAKAMDYMLVRWDRFTRFLDDGRICLTNNAAERSLRGIALGRKSWLFAGSLRGAERAAFFYALIVTAKLNDIDPLAWLADVLARINDMPQTRLHELLPWEWKARRTSPA